MKIYKNLLMIAAMAIAFTACSQEGDVPVLPTDEQPISFSASVPVKAFGVESRADNPTDWTLYYQLKGTTSLVSSTGGELDVTSGTEGYSFKARYAYKYKEGNEDRTEHRDLVWSVIEPNTKFYLTVEKDGVEYWAEGTKSTVESNFSVNFGVMKPRKTRFILNLTVSGSADKSGFTFSLSDVKKAADNAIVTEQAWPATTTTYVENDFSWDSTSEAANGKYTYSHDFAPQTVGNLTIKYGDTFTWTKSLSEIEVDFVGQKSTANQWKPGYQITLNVAVALDDLKPGAITVNGFTEGGSQDFNGTVVQP